MLSARALLSGRCVQASATAATLLSLLDDYDRLLSSDSNFMLGEHHRWPIPDSAPNPVPRRPLLGGQESRKKSKMTGGAGVGQWTKRDLDREHSIELALLY